VSILISLGSFALAAAESIKVGVHAPRGELKALTSWGEFGKYLSAEIGQPVEIVPVTPARFVEAMESKKLDFMLENPSHTVTLEERYGGVPLAVINGRYGAYFAGVIVAKKGNGITRSADLKGKNVMSLAPDAGGAGAYLFQAYHLKQQGIDVRRDLVLRQGRNQDDSVLAVQAGIMDAAFVRSGTLEAMAKEGKIKMEDFVVVDHRTDDRFSLEHTTALYPEWYFCAGANTSAALRAKVKAALLKMSADAPAAKAAGINGFAAPLPRDALKVAMKSMKVSPYDH
jgi:ABC-type phosphate/phosphonate transport system substrate-binding protein